MTVDANSISAAARSLDVNRSTIGIDSTVTIPMVRPAKQTDRTQNPTAQDLLLDYRMLLALVIWATNDWLLKPVLGTGLLGLATGKLSDLAGLIVLSAAVGALIAATRRSRSLSSIGRATALATPSLALIALNISTTVAVSYSTVMESITGFPHHVVVDPTDLIALVALIPARRILLHPQPLSTSQLKRHVCPAVVGLAVVAVAGASSFSSTSYTHLEQSGDDQLVVHDGHGSGGELAGTAMVLSGESTGWEMFSGEVTAGDRVTTFCSAADPDICVRGTGEPLRNRIEESADGGETWQEVWHVDGRESWVRNLASSEGTLEVTDIAETSDGRIAVAVGHLLPVIRSAAGVWSPTVADLRTFPVIVLFSLVAGSLAALAGVVGRRLTGHWIWFGPVFVGVATIWVTPYVFDLSVLGFAFVPAVALSAVVGLVSLVAIAVRSTLRTVALVPVLAMTAAATSVIPLLLWAAGIGTWALALFAASAITSLFVLWLAVGHRPPAGSPSLTDRSPLD